VTTKMLSSQEDKRKHHQLGLELLGFIKQVIVLSQQHRGVSSAVRGGNRTQITKLVHIQTELNTLINSGLRAELITFPQWESFLEYWPRLEKNVLTATSSANIVRQHNILIESHLSLFDDVNRYYKLHMIMLDEQIHSTELCLDILRTIELIAQARGVSSGICAAGLAEGADFIKLNFLKEAMIKSTKELAIALKSINNDELSGFLIKSADDVIENSEQLAALIENEVLIDGSISLNSQEVFSVATKPIEDLLTAFTKVQRHAEQNI